MIMIMQDLNNDNVMLMTLCVMTPSLVMRVDGKVDASKPDEGPVALSWDHIPL